MDPQPGPICLFRAMLFSKVWREFDRGLYQFFKRYIFVPICAPTFSKRKVLRQARLTHCSLLVWIILNIIALFMEMSSKSLYAVESFRRWREKTISDVNFRRVLAALQVLPFAFGLYSNIYFLGGSEIGALFKKRILDEETIPLRVTGAVLLTLGYFNAHCAIEIDRRNELRRKQVEEKKKLSAAKNK
ncbi:hypothetical protein OSTOST_23299 [Ostertagia ostertagi]